MRPLFLLALLTVACDQTPPPSDSGQADGCGDGICTEGCIVCPADCACPVCGDGQCDPDESCMDDCGTGDWLCPPTDAFSCPGVGFCCGGIGAVCCAAGTVACGNGACVLSSEASCAFGICPRALID